MILYSHIRKHFGEGDTRVDALREEAHERAHWQFAAIIDDAILRIRTVVPFLRDVRADARRERGKRAMERI